MDKTRSQVVEDFTSLRDMVPEIEYYLFFNYCLARHQGLDHEQALGALADQYHNLDEYQIRSVIDNIMAQIHSANKFLLDYLAQSNYDVTFVPIRRVRPVFGRRPRAVQDGGEGGEEGRPVYEGGFWRSGWFFFFVIAALLIAIFMTSRN